jgi:hypothetical protein
MTVARMAASYQHSIGPFLKGLEDVEWVHPSRTRHADDADVGGVGDAAGPGHVCTGVATPVAEKANNSGFKVVAHWIPPFDFAGVHLKLASTVSSVTAL